MKQPPVSKKLAAIMKKSANLHAERRAALKEAYGDPDFLRSVSLLVRHSGQAAVRMFPGGRTAWDVVEAADPSLCRYFRTLGIDWQEPRAEIGRLRTDLRAAGEEWERRVRRAKEDKKAGRPTADRPRPLLAVSHAELCGRLVADWSLRGEDGDAFDVGAGTPDTPPDDAPAPPGP